MNDQISSGSTKRPSTPAKSPTAALKGSARYSAWIIAGMESTTPPSTAHSSAEEQAKQNDGFKGDVGGEEVRHKRAEPDAEGEGNKKEGEKAEGLGGTALFREEEAAKGSDARQHAGYGGNHSQLYQQGDEDEPVGHVTNVSRNGGETETG